MEMVEQSSWINYYRVGKGFEVGVVQHYVVDSDDSEVGSQLVLDFEADMRNVEK
jgi:hypothetical protein